MSAGSEMLVRVRYVGGGEVIRNQAKAGSLSAAAMYKRILSFIAIFARLTLGAVRGKGPLCA